MMGWFRGGCRLKRKKSVVEDLVLFLQEVTRDLVLIVRVMSVGCRFDIPFLG